LANVHKLINFQPISIKLDSKRATLHSSRDMLHYFCENWKFTKWRQFVWNFKLL